MNSLFFVHWSSHSNSFFSPARFGFEIQERYGGGVKILECSYILHYSSLNLRWERCCQIRKTDLTKLKKTQISQLFR